MLKLALRFALITIAVLALPTPYALAKDKIWHIGLLDLNPPPTSMALFGNVKFFKEGLGQLGYEEGRDYVIDARFADTDRSRLPALAQELVDRKVDVIVTIGGVTTRAAKAATATIPIVMAGANYPVENGFVASLAHPGGNVTGLSRFPPGLLGKALQLFKDVAPNTSRVAILGADAPETGLQAAAGELNIAVLGHDTTDVKSISEFDAILSQIAEDHVDAMVVISNFTNDKYKKQLFEFLDGKKLPSMFEENYLVEYGDGLMSYFTSIAELRRRSAFFVDKILKGAQPGDVPVEQPTKFRLVINLKTAKMLGLNIPTSVLSMADKIIEE